jgi:hypothetical protein
MANPNVQAVSPQEIDDPLANPYMGWGIWVAPRQLGYTKPDYTIESNTTAFGDDAPLYSWVMVDWDWAHLEPQEGQYEWKDLDAMFKYWSSRGKHFVVRLWVVSDPGWKTEATAASVIPEWLWAKGLRYQEYQASGTSDISNPMKHREPDYLDPTYEDVYLPAFQKLLTAFAARYDKPDTPIIFTQVAGYGQWVDFAAWFSKYRWPDTEIKHVFFSRLVNMYANTFKHIRLSMADMGDWDNDPTWSLEQFLYPTALDIGISKGAGLMDNGFIVARSQGPRCRQITQRFWRNLPFLGEGWAYDEIKDVGTYGTLKENARVVLEYHTNFYHFYNYAQSYRRMMRDDRAILEMGLQSGGLGYRLVLTSASWPAELPAGHLLLIDQTWVNRNVGRLYVMHPLKVYLTDPQGNEKYSQIDHDFDETTWVKGETYTRTSVINLPNDLAPGEYDVRIAVVDQVGKPRIRLAIRGEDSDKRYKLGTIRILHGLQKSTSLLQGIGVDCTNTAVALLSMQIASGCRDTAREELNPAMAIYELPIPLP